MKKTLCKGLLLPLLILTLYSGVSAKAESDRPAPKPIPALKLFQDVKAIDIIVQTGHVYLLAQKCENRERECIEASVSESASESEIDLEVKYYERINSILPDVLKIQNFSPLLLKCFQRVFDPYFGYELKINLIDNNDDIIETEVDDNKLIIVVNIVINDHLSPPTAAVSIQFYRSSAPYNGLREMISQTSILVFPLDINEKQIDGYIRSMLDQIWVLDEAEAEIF